MPTVGFSFLLNFYQAPLILILSKKTKAQYITCPSVPNRKWWSRIWSQSHGLSACFLFYNGLSDRAPFLRPELRGIGPDVFPHPCHLVCAHLPSQITATQKLMQASWRHLLEPLHFSHFSHHESQKENRNFLSLNFRLLN